MKFKGSAVCEVNKAFNVAVLRYEGAKDELPNSDVTYDNIVTQGTLSLLIIIELIQLKFGQNLHQFVLQKTPAIRKELEI